MNLAIPTHRHYDRHHRPLHRSPIQILSMMKLGAGIDIPSQGTARRMDHFSHMIVAAESLAISSDLFRDRRGATHPTRS